MAATAGRRRHVLPLDGGVRRKPGPALRREGDYYNLLVDGFRHGHLYLPVKPEPELLALENPYDPVANAAYRLLDPSLYNGRYYLYFGPVPAVVRSCPGACCRSAATCPATSPRHSSPPLGSCSASCFCASSSAAGCRPRRRGWPLQPR